MNRISQNYLLYAIIIISLNLICNNQNLNRITSINTEDIQAILQVIPQHGNDSNPSYLNVYHKGAFYTGKITSLASQINIKNNEIINDLTIVVASDIEIVREEDEHNIIKGIKVTQDTPSAFYNATLSVQRLSNGKVTYNWDIKKIKSHYRCLPENTIIIHSNPNAIIVEGFDDDFNPTYPHAHNNNGFKGVLFLPLITLDVNTMDPIIDTCDMRSCHL